MKLRLLIIGLLINFSCTAQADTIAVHHKTKAFVKNFNYVYHHWSVEDTGVETKVDNLIRGLCSLMLMPGAENYTFAELQNTDIALVTSSDKKVRFFWWDDQLGGSMSHYSVVAQYSDSTGKNHCWNQLDMDWGMAIDSVIGVAEDCYLVFGWQHDGGLNGGYIISAFKITGSKASISKKLFQNGNSYIKEIDLIPASDFNGKALEEFSYDREKKQLYYRYEKVKATLVYDGKYFRKKGKT